MRYSEQGTKQTGRYLVIPRTLCFLYRDSRMLFLRGASDKRLWPNHLNGIGGHLEANEDPFEGARREIKEETGLHVDALEMKAVIHISGQGNDPGICIFVFIGPAPSGQLTPSREGELEWHDIQNLPWQEMVSDLPYLLPRILSSFDDEGKRGMIYGHYYEAQDGNMEFTFRDN